MGHGDTLVIADTNFPSDSIARQTVLGALLRMDNLTCGQAAQAILSVLPLDTFVDDFAGRMEVVGDPRDPCRMSDARSRSRSTGPRGGPGR